MEQSNQSGNQSLIPTDKNDPYFIAGHSQHDARVAEVRARFEEKYKDGEPVAAPGGFNAGLAANLQDLQAGKESGPAPYGLKEPAMAPPGVTLGDEALASFGDMARKEGFDREAAQGIVDAWGVLNDGVDEPSTGWDYESGMTELKRIWGMDTMTNVDRIGRFVASKPALKTWLESGPGNDPAVLTVLDVLARRADGSLAEYVKAIDKAYFDAKDPRHREAVRAKSVLYNLKLN